MQKTVAVKIGMKIHLQFLKHLSESIRDDQRNEAIELSVKEMSAVGRSKVRYVGGRAIRKIWENLRKFVKVNIYTENKSTLQKVHRHHHMCELFEENVIVPFAKLSESTKVAETLDVTKARQYRERGPIHISDNAYCFFMAMESECVKLINNHKLKEQKEDLIEVAKCTLKNNQELKAKWLACFQEDERTANEVIYYQVEIAIGMSEVEASFTFTFKKKNNFNCSFMVIINHHISSELAVGHVKLAERLCHGSWLVYCIHLLHAPDLPRNLNCAVRKKLEPDV